MRIFLTGATGFIGSRIVPELLAAGHQVLGLTRSDSGAQALEQAGAQVHRGTLEDPATLRSGAEQADAVIHTAFDHDFSNFLANCEKDRVAITAMGEVLKGSNRPLLITSGTGLGSHADGSPATEDVYDNTHPNPRAASEQAGQALLQAGVHVDVMRLPQVHNPERQGLISPLVAISKEKGRVAYVGEGANRWPAGHVGDVALLYRLAIDHALNGGAPGSRWNAVGEEGISARAIAQVLGEGLGLPVVSLTPEEAPEHFGWMAMFAALDMPASSAITRATLGWNPKGPGLIEDLKAMDYQAAFAG
ncbi:SDR family oxidoreductase [Novosphingobium terrae]|uniref:SDR family oxidoreductase n=1 Tax=Novosphingobium terrae TaxID=2726189 RepID=UPI00197E3A3B|nr:SDR family oxidoreductase [Novosphingobium terrae]